MKRSGLLLLSMLVLQVLSVSVAGAQEKSFKAELSGKESVPPVDTPAHGEATFQLSADGNSLSYKLSVSDIENVSMSHIHLGQAGKEGPVAVWLYPSSPPPALKEGKFSGVLAQGTITAANLMGPLKGKPLTALMEEIKNGNAYVNVHTKQHPGGEIRGQLK
jgi:CHRD domain